MGTVGRLRARLIAPGPRILMPEGDDPRVAEAALRIGTTGLAQPVVFTDPRRIGALADELGLDPLLVDVVDPAGLLTAEVIDTFAAERDLPHSVAARTVARPEVLAAVMVRRGLADALLAGATTSTRDVLMACSAVLGHARGVHHPSSCFLIEAPDGRALLFADCAVNPDPTAAELAEIAVVTADSARRIFGWEPRVAMLSYSTHGSGDGPSVEKVRSATALARALAPTLAIDGELQADAALEPFTARQKMATVGPVAGQANVLVFPDLDAGNIAYKLVRSLGHATAVGVILQGYRCPVSDVSRGATVEELVATAMVLAALVEAPVPVP